MSNIIPFRFGKANVRVIQKDGDPWFVAKDVCDVLELTDTNKALLGLDLDEKREHEQYSGSGRKPILINESGLYSLILRSRKPEAKRFKKWVTSEVLPSVRKHGAYLTPEAVEEVLSNPDTIIRLATDIKEERRKRAALEADVARLKPKADTMDALMATDTALPIGSVAKALYKDFGMGRNNMFRVLREKGILMANNEPKQVYIDRGYFRVVERRFEVRGKMKVGTQTLVYQKGVNFICKLLRPEAA